MNTTPRKVACPVSGETKPPVPRIDASHRTGLESRFEEEIARERSRLREKENPVSGKNDAR
jgi:hypothetical protein